MTDMIMSFERRCRHLFNMLYGHLPGQTERMQGELFKIFGNYRDWNWVSHKYKFRTSLLN